MNEKAAAHVTTADGAIETTPPPIPFRKSAVTSTPEVFGMLAMTLLVLALFYGLAWFARRQGWLDRWVGRRPAPDRVGPGLHVLEQLPISRKTTLYRVRCDGQDYLLAESAVPVQLVATGGPGETSE